MRKMHALATRAELPYQATHVELRPGALSTAERIVIGDILVCKEH